MNIALFCLLKWVKGPVVRGDKINANILILFPIEPDEFMFHALLGVRKLYDKEIFSRP